MSLKESIAMILAEGQGIRLAEFVRL